MSNVVELFPSTGDSRKVSLEDGYTRIADELIEELAKTDFSGRELRILLGVIRKTFGFRKPVDWIALSQFEEMTGIEKSNVSRTIKTLVERHILISDKRGHDRKLGINPHVSEWTGKVRKKGVVKTDNKVVGIDNKTSQTDNKPPKTDNHNKQYTNKQLKDSSSELSSGQGRAVKPVVRPDAAIQSRNGQKWGTQADLAIAQTMSDLIRQVTQDDKQPNFTEWSNTIRLMRERDNRTPEQIGALFGWVNKDSFWKTNILSPGKLREKWGQLAAKRNAERNGLTQTQGRRQKTTIERLTDDSWAEGMVYGD